MTDTPTILPMTPSDPAKVLEKAARVLGGTTGCGHGWVFPMPNGVKARCGGPLMCSDCAKDAASIGFVPVDPEMATKLLGK